MVPLVGIVAPLSSLSFSKSVCMYVCYTAYILVCKCIHVCRYASMKVYVYVVPVLACVDGSSSVVSISAAFISVTK